jgi:drug/metabolite transporter (DMT)-like permease
LLISCLVCSVGYAAAVIIGQNAAVQFGEIESTWVSRLSAALLLVPLALRERPAGRVSPLGWWGIAAMALFDVLSVIAVSSAGHLPDKELAAIGISAYGGIAVILAAIVLKEKVKPVQWAGISLIVGGVSALASAG